MLVRTECKSQRNHRPALVDYFYPGTSDGPSNRNQQKRLISVRMWPLPIIRPPSWKESRLNFLIETITGHQRQILRLILFAGLNSQLSERLPLHHLKTDQGHGKVENSLRGQGPVHPRITRHENHHQEIFSLPSGSTRKRMSLGETPHWLNEIAPSPAKLGELQGISPLKSVSANSALARLSSI